MDTRLGLHNASNETVSEGTLCLQDWLAAGSRFWSKVKQRGPKDCWLWTGCRFGGSGGKRYGQFSIRRQKIGAHRFAWIVAHGPIPSGLEICHSCDRPLCCNVKHMRLGTHAENVQEAVVRGRLHVPRPRRQKLSPVQLTEIDALLADGVQHATIARQYGVSRTWVGMYAKGNRRQYDRPAKKRAAA